jgi:hypothetical protein
MTNDRLAAPAATTDPTQAEFDAFTAWRNSQRAADGLAASAPQPAATSSAPAPASTVASAPAPSAPSFKLGQIVDTPAGVAAIISVADVTRTVAARDANGTIVGQQDVTSPGYRIAYLPNVTDSHHTEQELGLKVL